MFTINLKNNFYESVFDKAFIDELLKGNKPESYDYKLELDPPANAKIRACKKTIDSCPSNYTNTEISNLCQKSTAYRYAFEGLSYKNEYCAICNSLNVNMLQCAKRIDYNTFVNSLQILFDLSDLNEKSTIDLKVKYNDIELDFNKSVSFHHLNSRECNQMLGQDLSKKYLTIIGQAISISSLSLLILIYVKNKLYGNLPGKMLLSLSSALLFSQIFFLISTYLTRSLADKSQKENCDFSVGSDLGLKRIQEILPCYIAAVLTHFFHLNFFIWTSLMAFDLFRMFQKFGKINNDDQKFLRYYLISVVMPIIGIALLHLKNMNKLSYGIKSCFISNGLDILVFFVVPIATVLFLNLLFLIFSVYYVKKADILSAKYFSQDKLSNMNKKNEKSRLLLFAKLFILTGMTWIIGVVSSLMNKKYCVVWYFYIILNSLQGLFIFCTYGFNHNSKSNIKSNVSKIMSYFSKEKMNFKDKTSRTNSSENQISVSK
ncbi:G- coupled receptor Mth2 [Brachionus plicatilis]|uniref:G-coupled receptor Mth2 n=1 Tax=Brachionus plicatilis TaxID=10195 RepID=A0A3M7P9R1_BRAPC|nr:G- coupled receptor Mth2 [Brachionus plicatilis]